MELGNMAFGNSRGNYPVNRDYQDAFVEGVLGEFGMDGHGHADKWRWLPAGKELELPYGWADLPDGGYTNTVFTVRPYWWGDCTCGWETVECAFKEVHDPACYQARIRDLRSRRVYSGNLVKQKWEARQYAKARRRLREEMGLDPAVPEDRDCGCDFMSKWEAHVAAQAWKGEPGHRPDCRYVLPNFECHPLGFSMKWYKYALRDSYSNVPLDDAMMAKLTQLAGAMSFFYRDPPANKPVAGNAREVANLLESWMAEGDGEEGDPPDIEPVQI